MKWSFQLLLAVFCTETEDCRSPIVSNTFLRDENALIDYPFEFSIYDGKRRVHGTGKFFEKGEDVSFESDVFNVPFIDHHLIEAIISRDKLQNS